MNEKENQGAAAPRTALRGALAREARKLSMQVVRGTAPRMERGVFSQQHPCALGVITLRAYGQATYPSLLVRSVGVEDAEGPVIAANDDARCRDGLPWALLSLADALDAAPAAPKEPQP